MSKHDDDDDDGKGNELDDDVLLGHRVHGGLDDDEKDDKGAGEASLLDRVRQFCMSSGFEQQFDDFAGAPLAPHARQLRFSSA